MNVTRVHGDYSVIGKEFVNFISLNIFITTFKRFKEAGVLEKESFKDVLDDLQYAWRIVTPEERNAISLNRTWILSVGKPTSDDKSWVHTLERMFTIMDSLNICTKIKSKDNNKDSSIDNNKKMYIV